jgi:pimeloyl-ACP methyl ester carboxylesterase
MGMESTGGGRKEGPDAKMAPMRSLLFFLPVAAYGAACVSTTGCTEWVTYRTGPGRSMVYRTYSLTEKNENIRRAFVLVHGATRNADDYFRTAVAAAFLAGALDDTIVIAPRFASKTGGSCADTLAENEVSWVCSGDSWRSGAVSPTHKNLTSFDFADELLKKLANKQVFPNLKAIVLAGHSAGGQFVNRYEMANRVHDSLGVSVTYVVSNPSSYAYPDKVRPLADGKQMGAFADQAKCAGFNRWPYGFESRGNGYTAKVPDEQLKKQLGARPTVYLLGDQDTLPLAGFDDSCPAMAQGKTRLARGQAFASYAVSKYGAKDHKTVVVPLCGHNARCMFTSEAALPIVFPQE